MKEDFAEFLRGTVSELRKKALEEEGGMISVPALRDACARFVERHEFKPGDIVDFKPGMRKGSQLGPYIVVEVLSEPIMNPAKDVVSVYFREPLDIICGRVFPDGGFSCWYWDSRRFEPYRGPEKVEAAETAETAAQ